MSSVPPWLNFIKSSRQTILLAVVLVAASLAVIYADAPAFQPVPGRDSGNFMYIGQQMLRGQRLYAELFDDKPPLIYAVNALGLWLGGGSPWGVWALEAVSLAAASLLGFGLLSTAAGPLPAFLAMLAFLGDLLHVLLGGNFTEEYALPFEFLILALVLPAALEKPLRWRAFFAGAAWGIIFFFKQNFWDMGLAAGAFLFIRGVYWWKKGRMWDAAWYAGGFLALCAIVAGAFAASGTLGDLWDATFVSNFAYISTPGAVTNYTRFDLFQQALAQLNSRGDWIVAMPYVALALLQCALFGLFVVTRDSRRWPAWLTPRRRFLFCLGSGILAAVAVFLVDVARGKGVSVGAVQVLALALCAEWILFGFLQWQGRLAGWLCRVLADAFPPRLAILAAIGGLAFLLDLASISLSGKFFTHYFLMLFPATAILSAVVAKVFLSVRRPAWLRLGAALALLGAFVPAGLLPLANTANQYKVRDDPQIEAAVAYVDAHTAPADGVLVWGSEPVVNFLSGRTRPNRFVFMSQMFLPGYAAPAQADEMLRDLQSHPPRLIINAYTCGVPFIDYLSNCGGALSYWDEVFTFVRQHYAHVADVGPNKWQIYELR